uniref:Uncharacterized protein n=1 Tax=Setaria viridis TaxID=4556 RepID=A0A4U6U200_SETVI|nr:hypothetical protein SEVIR_6G105550v2 [Setaria viridis]
MAARSSKARTTRGRYAPGHRGGALPRRLDPEKKVRSEQPWRKAKRAADGSSWRRRSSNYIAHIC